MRLLIIGGSGFLSGTLVHQALSLGHKVSIVTRGLRPPPSQVRVIRADRHQQTKFASALAQEDSWDLVVDCIGFNAQDARQDVDVFSGRCRHLAFVSTDFVYDPRRRTIPQPEDPAHYLQSGYGGGKRAAEEIFLAAGIGQLPWTVFRPSHIYGPGSLLGCLPLHGRDPDLLSRLKSGDPLRLIGGGHYLQNPVFAPDLALTFLSLAGNQGAIGKVFNVANPDVVESRRYYEVIAEILGCEAFFENVETNAFLAENPDKAPFCCDRVYDLSLLQASGLAVPGTSLRDGLKKQVAALESIPFRNLRPGFCSESGLDWSC